MHIHEELRQICQSGGSCGCGIPGRRVPPSAPAERCRRWAKAPRRGLAWVGAALPQSSPPADIIFEPLERWPLLKGRWRLVPGVPGRGEAAARGKPEVAAGWRVPGRAGAEAPRRRLAEVRPRQCEGFPPSPRRGRAGGDSPAAARGAGAGAELPRRREPPWEDERERKAKISKEQKVSGGIGC